MSDLKITTPYFFDDPQTDRLMRMVMTLAAEVAVLRERLDTHEQVAAAKSLFSPADIEAFEPNAEVSASREAWRGHMLDRLVTLMEEDMEKGR